MSSEERPDDLMFLYSVCLNVFVVNDNQRSDETSCFALGPRKSGLNFLGNEAVKRFFWARPAST